MQRVGVMGGKWTLPLEFPREVNGNSGDMIHTLAPLEIIPGSVYFTDDRFRLSGARSFREFVNNYGTHLIVVLANVLRNGKKDGSIYSRLQRALEKYDKPIVVFGLGIQAEHMDIDSISLPPEAISLMQFLSSRAEVVGVRGEFTRKVLAELCGVKNAYVTGCPSLFARPNAIRELQTAHKNGEIAHGSPAFNVTNLAREQERHILATGIRTNAFMVEPVSRSGYDYHRALQLNDEVEPPYYLKSMLKQSQYHLTSDKVREYYKTRFRMFRQTQPWFDFNREFVSWSYGTRFHGNMATLLSGRPAVWLTHDARTEELADFMHLPRVPLRDAAQMSTQDIFKHTDLEEFFDNINGLFRNFNRYLELNGLKGIEAPL